MFCCIEVQLKKRRNTLEINTKSHELPKYHGVFLGFSAPQLMSKNSRASHWVPKLMTFAPCCCNQLHLKKHQFRFSWYGLHIAYTVYDKILLLRIHDMSCTYTTMYITYVYTHWISSYCMKLAMQDYCKQMQHWKQGSFMQLKSWNVEMTIGGLSLSPALCGLAATWWLRSSKIPTASRSRSCSAYRWSTPAQSKVYTSKSKVF